MAEDKKETILLPAKPTEPLDSDCCGTGCALCVFDIYKTQLKRWEKQCEEILNDGNSSCNKVESQDSCNSITPFEYKLFKLVNIIPETKVSNVYTFSCSSVTETDSESTVQKLGSLFPVKVGQHVLLKIANLSRQYTVLKVNDNTDTFDILIKVYPHGQLTPLINKIIVGDLIELRGPFGSELPYKPNTYCNVLMLAAGTGIAPMFRVIENILNNDEDETRIRMMFSCKSIDEVMLRDYLKSWSAYWNFQIEYFLTIKDDNIPYGWKVEFKRICYQTLEKVVTSKPFLGKTNLFLICGTKSFEKDILNYLHRLGVSDDFIRVF